MQHKRLVVELQLRGLEWKHFASVPTYYDMPRYSEASDILDAGGAWNDSVWPCMDSIRYRYHFGLLTRRSQNGKPDMKKKNTRHPR